LLISPLHSVFLISFLYIYLKGMEYCNLFIGEALLPFHQFSTKLALTILFFINFWRLQFIHCIGACNLGTIIDIRLHTLLLENFNNLIMYSHIIIIFIILLSFIHLLSLWCLHFCWAIKGSTLYIILVSIDWFGQDICYVRFL
jgi:hypothetical protein